MISVARRKQRRRRGHERSELGDEVTVPVRTCWANYICWFNDPNRLHSTITQHQAYIVYNTQYKQYLAV